MARPVLITGAAGFIGAWIIKRLADEDVDVIATGRRPNERRLRLVMEGDAPGNVSWETLDVSQTRDVIALAKRYKPRTIIHLAALLTPDCRDNPPEAVRVNMLGDANVFEAARQIEDAQVIYTSSAAARPRGPGNRIVSLYGACKAAGEELARFYHADHGVPSMGLRPAIVYGVGRDAGATAAISEAMQAAAGGLSYRLPWRMLTIFEFAEDLADMYARVAMASLEGASVSEINIQPCSTDAVIDAIKAAIPDADIAYADNAPERTGAIKELSNEPLARVIGDLSLTPLEEGVRRSIAHFQRLEGKEAFA